jgi:predicted ArsR family transcriptional regulator
MRVMADRTRSERIASVATLDDPTRRAVFDFVSSSTSAVTRDATADALHITRRIAASHLDKLAEQGLLSVEFRRLHARTGPGAGRPAKLYRRSVTEVAVSVPERKYDLVAGLFAAAIAEAIDTGDDIAEILDKTAYDAGQAIAVTTLNLITRLEEIGYEPRETESDDGGLILANCPFHGLAQHHADLVCGLNLNLLRGMTTGAGADYRLILDPSPGRCCVRLVPADN